MTAAPGYLNPASTVLLPKQLTLTGFIQTVLAGVSGLPGQMVVPQLQVDPPKDPDIEIDWMDFVIDVQRPDANAYENVDSDTGATDFQRNEDMEILCNVYGAHAHETYGLIRDGFQLQQNRAALYLSNMGFTKVTEAKRVPDLVNERFRTKLAFGVYIQRMIQRTYTIRTIVSMSGVVHTFLGTEPYLLPFAAGEDE